MKIVEEIRANKYNVQCGDIACLHKNLNKRAFGIIQSPNPSPIKKKNKSSNIDGTRRHQGTNLGKNQHSSKEVQSEKVFTTGLDEFSKQVSTQNDQGTSLGQDCSKEKICLFCNAKVKTYIPHLKRNSNCMNFYFNKFDLSIGSYEEKIEKLKHKLKMAEQSKRRAVKDRKEETVKRNYERRNYNQNSVNCLNSFTNIVETILSTFCKTCDCYVSPQSLIKVDESHPLFEEYGKISICKWCDVFQKDITATWSAIDNEATARWLKENITLKKKIFSLNKSLNSRNIPSNVGHITFTINGRLSMVGYPVVNKEHLENVDPPLNEHSRINHPTVLLADEFFIENPIQTVSRELAELAAKSFNSNIEKLFSILYYDRHEIISSCKNRRNRENELKKEGRFFDGQLILNQVTNMKGCCPFPIYGLCVSHF